MGKMTARTERMRTAVNETPTHNHDSGPKEVPRSEAVKTKYTGPASRITTSSAKLVEIIMKSSPPKLVMD